MATDLRIAVISDVHGNTYALQAVLADITRAAPDLIVNLGDQIEGSANPALAYQLQADLNAAEVRGNNDEKLWPGGRRDELGRRFQAFLETQLKAEELARLAALPLTAICAQGRVFACHGTPESAWTSLLWGYAGEAYRARDPRELRAIVEPLNAQVVLCGHTHRAGATRAGDTLVVNVGAVSDQVDGDPRARWTLLEARGERWTPDFRAVPYDIDAAVAWSRAHSPFAYSEEPILRSGTLEARGWPPAGEQFT